MMGILSVIVVMLFVFVKFREVYFEGKHDDGNRSSKYHGSRGPAVSLPGSTDSPSIITIAIQPLHLKGKIEIPTLLICAQCPK